MFEFIVGILQTVSKQYQYHSDPAENAVFTGFSGLLQSFPLNSPRGFRRYIVKHPVHAFDLVDDAVDYL